ncbi:hypothetical protein FHS16_004134 [Paenibacillus endophyticus]|uniref:Uncharacterized protein n=1 Tax=Paenibacillus endophyticus TaxID=1294268 RepID=A0A7W5GC33_9BACL|nr:hypothetical protein [Paenibacillus endophyticus]MBB3154058.1 hypothetical protein [Paenibacillus endophyticus]
MSKNNNSLDSGDSHLLKASLLACDSVEIVHEKKCYKLGHVVNEIEVPLFPYACKTSFFIKFSYLPNDHTIDFSLEIVDPAGVIIAAIPPNAIHNVRKKDQVAGCDTDRTIIYVVSMPGIFQASLKVDGTLMDTYPITIRQFDIIADI